MSIRRIVILLLVWLNSVPSIGAPGPVVTDIKVKDNQKVESDAIIMLLKSQKGEELDSDIVAQDIRELYALGYFSNIEIYQEALGQGVTLTIEVVEKPSIASITYEGMNEVTEDDLKEKVESKQYTIVDEAKITRDLRVIEKQYLDKGYYLARASYKLTPKDANEVDLVYTVEEGGIVRVADVHMLGNKYFPTSDLVSKMALRPYTRVGAYSSQGSLFQDDFLKRDLEFLAYYYKDQGFAEVKVAKPISKLDKDRKFVRLTFEIEEGLQYRVGKIDVVGDLLYPKEELIEAMKLKPTELFRFSFFQKDVEMLNDKYGDLGYAFVDTNPKTKFNREANPPTVDLVYEITKGEKVYFGAFTVMGNDKTRDNVVRRELEVADAELYSGTRLSQSKKNIDRLGFFEDTQAVRKRDEEDQKLLNYDLKVKEKPTGQVQAAVGFQPQETRTDNRWYGQALYREENQSGYGWQTSIQGRWSSGRSYELNLGFTNPRLNDSDWSLGFTAFLKQNVRPLTDNIDIEERRVGGSVTIGRKIIELIRASITYEITRITSSSEGFVLNRFREDGTKSTGKFTLSRNSTNNYLDPSEGSNVRLTQASSGGPLGGDYNFMESTAEAGLYLPLDFTETYRTFFHFQLNLGHVYAHGDHEVPMFERYRLGGPYDLRGYGSDEIGPHFNILNNPQGQRSRFNMGGDKQMYYQIEYLVPLIQEANLRSVIFQDGGRVYDDQEALEFSDLYYDYGFGLRWATPLGPFRFEWAYPIKDGKTGKGRFVLSFGY